MLIQGKQYKILRQAAQNGDEKAKMLLKMQFNNQTDGFEGLLEEYFSPQQEDVEEMSATQSQEEQEYHEQEPECQNWADICDKLIEDEIEAINGYDATILCLTNDTLLSDATRKGALSIVQDIKNDELEHIEKLKKLKNDCQKVNE